MTSALLWKGAASSLLLLAGGEGTASLHTGHTSMARGEQGHRVASGSEGVAEEQQQERFDERLESLLGS